MKTSKTTIIMLVFALTALFAAPAQAESATVTIKGVNGGGAIPIIEGDGTAWPSMFAGEFNLDVDGVAHNGYCIEYGVYLYLNTPYAATVSEAPASEPWCAMSYILQNYEAVDSFSASSIQLAVWKLLDPGMVSENAAIEANANAMLAEAEGLCPLMCRPTSELSINAAINDSGLLEASIVATQDGVPMVGQDVQVSASAGEIVEPVGGVGVTDANGVLTVLVDPGDAGSLTLDASAEGYALLTFDMGPDVQNVTALDLEPCQIAASASFDLYVGYGDPRTIGFWKHQTVSNLTGRGRVHVEQEVMEGWLPLDVFGYEIDSFQKLHETLWPVLSKMKSMIKNKFKNKCKHHGKKCGGCDNDNGVTDVTGGDDNFSWMETRALQQCTATLLNLNYGELSWNSLVDTDRDGQADSSFSEAWDRAEEAFLSGDAETAKTICDNINNL